MLSFVYPFIKFTGHNFWIGCKPVLILYLLYFIFSTRYTRGHFINKNILSVGNEEKNISKAWVCAYYTLLLLYFFLPTTGTTDNLIICMAQTYLQYEALLSGIMVAILIFLILSEATWQHIRILDKTENLLTLSGVVATILVQQVDSAWIANFFWFTVLGMMYVQRWYLWENFATVNSPSERMSDFQPVRTYNQLLPQQRALAQKLADMVCNCDVNEPVSICVAGKWGAGKTSIVNGTIDFLKKDNSSQYEVLYINTMELDTLSSLFTYVFDRIRNILKKRGAYVGIGSEYRKFIASAVGKITDTSVATLLEGRLFPSLKDYRTQMIELEGCISSVLGKDKILIVVDDVERCDNEKARQFIFFIKEIATLRNCIAIFLTDYEYLNQRLCLSIASRTDRLDEKNGFFYEKFFNYRIDTPLLDSEESMSRLWYEIGEEAKEFDFRTPHELFAIFKARLQLEENECKEKLQASRTQEEKENLQIQSEELNRLGIFFNTNILLPRMLVKYRGTMKREYAKLRHAYMKDGKFKEDASRFFSLIRFDEILFLLVYIEVCTPYESLCLKEQGVIYLKYSPDDAEDSRKLIHKMSEGLLYSARRVFDRTNEDYRCNEATRFVQAYIDGDLPAKVEGFSSRNEMWRDAILRNDKEVIKPHWTEMVQMVAQNYGWTDPAQGEHYLSMLFSFARNEFLPSPEGIDRVFTIFEKSQRNFDVFSAHIAIIKLFNEELGDALTGCSQKNIDLLEQFSGQYFLHRTSPVCSAANYIAPAECGRTEDFRRKICDANDYMLYADNPTDSLNKFLDRICTELPSLSLPQNDDVFQRLRSLANEEEKYLIEKGLIQYEDMKDCLHLLRTAIEDMEHFVSLLQTVKKVMIPTGAFSTTINLSDMDKTIQQFKDALKAPNASCDTSLRLNLQTLFNNIRSSDIELSDQQYQELQNIITNSEELFGSAPYNRKILADHRRCSSRGNPASSTPDCTDEDIKP